MWEGQDVSNPLHSTGHSTGRSDRDLPPSSLLPEGGGGGGMRGHRLKDKSRNRVTIMKYTWIVHLFYWHGWQRNLLFDLAGLQVELVNLKPHDSHLRLGSEPQAARVVLERLSKHHQTTSVVHAAVFLHGIMLITSSLTNRAPGHVPSAPLRNLLQQHCPPAFSRAEQAAGRPALICVVRQEWKQTHLPSDHRKHPHVHPP